MNILIIDNYDSFTYNLVHMLRPLVAELKVVRNDKIEPEACLGFDGLIFSPGPGIPAEAGRLLDIIALCYGKIPMLGICLGHQAIAEYLGGQLRNLSDVFHGIASEIQIDYTDCLFEGLPARITVGRYHSWVAEFENVPEGMQISAQTACGQIMAIEQVVQKSFGVQFHPESILTPEGEHIIKNFLKHINQAIPCETI